MPAKPSPDFPQFRVLRATFKNGNKLKTARRKQELLNGQSFFLNDVRKNAVFERLRRCYNPLRFSFNFLIQPIDTVGNKDYKLSINQT